MGDDEQRLMARARERDSAALSEIYRRYAGRIYTYLYHRLGDRQLAEDLTGEVFVRMLEAIASAHFARTSLSGWLYRIAHNLAVDHYRGGEPVVPLDEGLVAIGDGPAATLDRKLAQDRLRAALRTLTEEQQQVIVLRFGEGLTAGQAAEVMDKSEGAVWALQHRALAHLRRILEEELV